MAVRCGRRVERRPREEGASRRSALLLVTAGRWATTPEVPRTAVLVRLAYAFTDAQLLCIMADIVAAILWHKKASQVRHTGFGFQC
jgi:hypothetical protein